MALEFEKLTTHLKEVLLNLKHLSPMQRFNEVSKPRFELQWQTVAFRYGMEKMERQAWMIPDQEILNQTSQPEPTTDSPGSLQEQTFPNEHENGFVIAPPFGSAPAYGSDDVTARQAYPGLILQRASAPRNAPGLTSAAPNGAGASYAEDLRSSRLHFRERTHSQATEENGESKEQHDEVQSGTNKMP